MSRLFFHIFYYYWEKENHVLYRGLRYVEVFLYRGSTLFYFMSRLTLYESVVNFCIQRNRRQFCMRMRASAERQQSWRINSDGGKSKTRVKLQSF